MTQDASDRSKRVLAALIREYIASGEPVASTLLVTAAGLGVSSATVRSILARLEEEGYVQQPHTSAGRIPTDRGYRFYVDLLLDSRRPRYRARAAVLERMTEERLLYDALRARAMRLASSTFADLPDDRTMYVEGMPALLDDASGLTVQTLQALLEMIEEKQKLLQLLNEYIDGPGLSVVIGAEHLDPSLRPFSLVLSTYDDGYGIGTVGVIGPTRMRYSRAIAAVEGAAQAVSKMLRDPN